MIAKSSRSTTPGVHVAGATTRDGTRAAVRGTLQLAIENATIATEMVLPHTAA